MGKLSIVTDSSSNPEKLKINVADKKIYYGDSSETVILIEGSLKYRPLHCSELNNRLSNRNWNKSETLFISGIEGENNEDDPMLRYRKYTNSENKPMGEIDIINISDNNTNLSFPLCGKLSENTKSEISEAYENIFDTSEVAASEEVCFLGSSKRIMNTSECQESIDLIKGYDSYTFSLNLKDLIEYSSYPGTTAKVRLSLRYSKINSEGTEASIYSYYTTFSAFEYTSNSELIIENMIEIIKDTEDLIRIEYLDGTLQLFPVSQRISECIINDCTIIYGKFR